MEIAIQNWGTGQGGREEGWARTVEGARESEFEEKRPLES